MQAVAVDLADDRFDITFDGAVIAREDMIASIKAVGFEAVVVPKPEAPTATLASVDTSVLPDDLRQLLAKARTDNKLVLLRFTGPG